MRYVTIVLYRNDTIMIHDVAAGMIVWVHE